MLSFINKVIHKLVCSLLRFETETLWLSCYQWYCITLPRCATLITLQANNVMCKFLPEAFTQ